MAKSGKVVGVGPWARVATKVGQRRESLRIGQEKAAALAGISRETWAQVEKGVNTNYRHSTLVGICEAIRWDPTSIDRILQGQEPIELPPDGAVELADLAARVDGLEAAIGQLIKEFAAIRAAFGEPGPHRRGA